MAGQNTVNHVVFGAVRRPAELSELVGVDVRGFKHAASNQAMSHSLKRHGVGGVELLRGQKPVRTEDFARLPEVIRLGKYEAAKDRKFGPPRFKIVADLDGETFHYVGEVRRKQRRIDMVTLWKSK